MAIIGTGDIASILQDRRGVTFFASGVSDSQETKNSAFWRERDLLMDQSRRNCLFYFSTISQFYPKKSAYVQHKLAMEKLVRDNWACYVILKIGNITWGINPHTFLNALRARKAAGLPLIIHEEYKYMITEQHLLTLTNGLPIDRRIEICAFSYMKLVKDLL